MLVASSSEETSQALKDLEADYRPLLLKEDERGDEVLSIEKIAKDQSPVVKLVGEAGPETTGNCSVHTSFTVPAVEPGTSQLRWLFGNLGRSTAPSVTNVYALLASELTFRVTG